MTGYWYEIFVPEHVHLRKISIIFLKREQKLIFT
jgi:hypothetical protein